VPGPVEEAPSAPVGIAESTDAEAEPEERAESASSAPDDPQAPEGAVEAAEFTDDSDPARHRKPAEPGDSSAPALVNPEPANDEQ
jgi:hypothetical protein